MGVDAALGRTFHAEDALGRNPVAVISYSYWKSRFGGEPSVLGKIIQVDGAPLTIIGVTPRRFFGAEVGRSPEVTVPVTL
jgi:hypothetical protein